MIVQEKYSHSGGMGNGTPLPVAFFARKTRANKFAHATLSVVGVMGVVVTALFSAGCYTIEQGFRYEYDGKVYRPDGRTPVKGATIRLARPDAPEAPEMPEKQVKSAPKYMDKSTKPRTNGEGRYVGVLETVKGWKYSENFGWHSGPAKPPEPPVLDEVIVYVQEKGAGTVGYRVKVPAEAQAEAISGLRKVHVPDLLIPYVPTTRGTTRPATTQATTAP